MYDDKRNKSDMTICFLINEDIYNGATDEICIFFLKLQVEL